VGRSWIGKKKSGGKEINPSEIVLVDWKRSKSGKFHQIESNIKRNLARVRRFPGVSTRKGKNKKGRERKPKGG